jgi:energy-converting hydrogenase B subunit D
MMFTIIASTLCVAMLVAALLALYHKRLIIGVIAAGAVSLTASVLFLLLAAPDVAMTEAAIGSGLSTIIFFYTLKRTGRKKENG